MLNDRYQLLFRSLMGLYLNEGKPVGSTALAKLPEVGLSSATVRNVMADLERMGLIKAPHTSAGRIPTQKGYRFFVDSIATFNLPNDDYATSVRSALENDLNQDALLQGASRVLSGVTGMASLVLMPKKESEVLKYIDFIPLSESRILVLLVFNDRDAQNRIVELDRPFNADELQKVARFLNEYCGGKTLDQAREFLVSRMSQIRESANELMMSVISATDRVLQNQVQQTLPFLVMGKTKLLNYQELADSEKLKALFQAFDQHNNILGLLDKSMQAKGVQVFIGNECGSDIYQDCSIVTRPYEVEGEILGVLGVVGPSRMDYQKVVPKVDVTAKILESLLKK
ncbi:heat-inducible transcriptional repressor HrcA [Thiomicrorhabdus heinhorstiae]|uniref:Heat-inducible transcription repressor HrcA n=1 Tax=Thiomicrorhabdus heinhorstiae TaxID=2748010 RepID=A0ABS0BXT5_9GAMM|nr:heat-inducible transcriptional repressor HrcA [Thiomicrorhabdus heinhorstiae]MBF6057890.1 heat-inducible transcription repressor HrcA [Thiomicrorhabdus heinhorstiae]